MLKVNNEQNSERRGDIIKIKEIFENIAKIAVFVLIVLLPFITVANMIGTNVLLDSFDNPQPYQYIKITSEELEPTIAKGSYIILQKSSHPKFTINNDDTILYLNNEDRIACDKVVYTSKIGPVTQYFIHDQQTIEHNQIIYDSYILGKVIGVVDNNPWSTLALKTWTVSINDLNFNAIFSNE